MEVASERQGGVWGRLWVMVFPDIEEAGGKTRSGSETMSSFGQRGFMVPVEGHPGGEEQKTAGCLVWRIGELQRAPSGGRPPSFESRAGITNFSLQIKLREAKQRP